MLRRAFERVALPQRRAAYTMLFSTTPADYISTEHMRSARPFTGVRESKKNKGGYGGANSAGTRHARREPRYGTSTVVGKDKLHRKGERFRRRVTPPPFPGHETDVQTMMDSKEAAALTPDWRMGRRGRAADQAAAARVANGKDKTTASNSEEKDAASLASPSATRQSTGMEQKGPNGGVISENQRTSNASAADDEAHTDDAETGDATAPPVLCPTCLMASSPALGELLDRWLPVHQSQRHITTNGRGSPIGGAMRYLPRGELLRVLAAMVLGVALTKFYFDLTRFDLVYHGIWRVGSKKQSELVARLDYYVSTAVVAVGLCVSVAINYWFCALVLGRRQYASQQICRGFARAAPAPWAGRLRYVLGVD